MSELTKTHTRTISAQTDFYIGVQEFESLIIEVENNGANAITSIITARQIEPTENYYDYLIIKADYQDTTKTVSYGGSNIYDLAPAATGFIQLPCSGFYRYRLRITPFAETTIRLTTTLSDEPVATQGDSSFVTIADEAARLAITSPDPNKFYHQLDNDTYWKWDGAAWVQTNPFGSGGISTVFGRTGPTIVSQSGDYNSTQVSHDTGNVDDKLDELETDGAARDTAITGNTSAITSLNLATSVLQANDATQDSAIISLQTGQSTQDAAIALNTTNITANTTAITGNTNTISTLQATQGATNTNLQNQITANDTDIDTLNTAVTGKADAVHNHVLANITDAGNVAGLNYGTLLNTAAGQLNVDFSTVPLTVLLDGTDEFPIRKSDGTHRRITKDNLFSQILTGAGYAGVARVNGSILEDQDGNPINDANGTSGRWYWIGTGGTVNLGSGSLTLGVFDLIAHSNGAYDQIVNDNAVTGVASFNGRTGVVIPTLGDFATDLIGDNSTAGNANLTITLDALLSQQASNTAGIATNTGNIATNTAAIAAIDTSNKVTKGGDNQALIIGTNTIDTVELKSANTGRLWITGGGNIGFKVSNPQTDFDFDGGVRFRNLTEQVAYTRFPVIDTNGNFGWQAIADLLKVSDLATQVEAEAGTDNTKWMSPLRVKEAITAQAQAVGDLGLAVEGLKIVYVSATSLRFDAVSGLNQAVVVGTNFREWATLTSGFTKTLSAYVAGSGNGGLVTGATASGAEDIFVWIVKESAGVADVVFSNDASGATVDAQNANWGKRCIGVFKLSGGGFSNFFMLSNREIVANFGTTACAAIASWTDFPVNNIPSTGDIEIDFLLKAGFPAFGAGSEFYLSAASPLTTSVSPLPVGGSPVAGRIYDAYASYQTGFTWAENSRKTIITNNGSIALAKTGAAYLSADYESSIIPHYYRYVGES